ncbi:hypothetical protein HIM_12541 [Hirsutella minnesotensis 3608]|uniref:SWIM-type domain-containing protein n=2 Tax=Hirsutella minnesotensis 3608 TaxID=1043627 RepID=A0A0F7ZZZ4_9HYPO|nr:hypothetical protein HIM_12541 [Hirsutella minnesotensis 3608]
MKSFLWSSTGDLTSVFQRLRAFWSHQAEEISTKHQATGHKIATSTLQPVFAKIRPNSSDWALLQIGAEYRAMPARVEGNTEPPAGRCDSQHYCTFKSVFGLPCRHDTFKRLKVAAAGLCAVIPFEMNEVDEFWHQQRPRPRTDDAPLEPLPVRSKGRPKGSLNIEKSTRRDASKFEVIKSLELAEAEAEASAPPPSTAPAALPGGIRKSTRKRKANGEADGRGRPATAKATANSTANSTARGLDHLRRHGDSYEPGTEAPKAWQREAYDELAGETQGTIHVQLSQASRAALAFNDEEDPLADFDFDALERQATRDAQLQAQLGNLDVLDEADELA